MNKDTELKPCPFCGGKPECGVRRLPGHLCTVLPGLPAPEPGGKETGKALEVSAWRKQF